MLSPTTSRDGIGARRILAALGVSVLLHVAVLTKPGSLSFADKTIGSQSLQISLLAPTAVTPAVSQPKMESVPGPAEPKRKTASIVEAPADKPKVPQKPPETALTVPAHAAPSSSALKPDQTGPALGIPLPGLIGPVQRVALEFELFSGSDRQLIATARQLYTTDNAEHYGVSIEQTAKEEDAGGGEPWQLQISGTITGQGLSPSLFQMHGAVPERLMASKGASENPSVLPTKTRSGRIPDGILDRQSLLYQFMQQPPSLSGGQLWLTDGVMHRLYRYRLAGAESFTIPSLGGVRTIKLVLSTTDSPEVIELWLIPDLHYLPAKLRYTDRNGVITEQLVTALEFN